MRITIHEKTRDSIERLLSMASSGDELEIRFGKIIKNKFIPSVNNFIFTNLVESLSKEVKPVVKKSRVYYYKDTSVRRIDGGGKIIYEDKRKIDIVDLSFSPIDIRISLSSEKETTNIPSTDPTFWRDREKNVFSFDNFDIELSIIDKKNKEVEIEFKLKITNIQDLVIPLKKVLELMFPERLFMIPYSEEEQIRFERSKLKGMSKHPRNIKKKDILTLYDYSVTNKLNGIGCDLFITDNGIYILNSTNIDKVSSSVLPKYLNTVLEGEWFNGSFHIFNTIFVSGKNVSEENHSKRIEYSKIIVKDLESLFPCEVKRFFKSSINSFNRNEVSFGIVNDIKDTLKYMVSRYGKDIMKHNDGIMFTPEIGQPLKFKCSSTMTIDLQLSNEQLINGEKRYTANVYTYDNEIIPFTGKHIYRGGNMSTLKIDPLVVVKKDNPLYNYIANGLIVECLYDKKNTYFIPERVRWDKALPNFIEIAIDVFKDILYPLSLEEIIETLENKSSIGFTQKTEKEGENCLIPVLEKLEKKEQSIGDRSFQKSQSESIGDRSFQKKGNENCLIPMRKFHNKMKNKLIAEYCKNADVLDLGFGRGGDLLKYSDAGTRFIYGIEPNAENLDEAKRRYKENDYNVEVEFVNCKAQETSKINKSMNYKKVDIVASFFSLTFFFQNEKELDLLLNTISGNTKIGGHMIGTTMSGDEAYKFFKGKDSIEYKNCYRIDKKYIDDDVEEFGKKITIHLDETIVTEQDEYLVFFEIFKKKMEIKGFKLVKYIQFNPPSTLNKPAGELSRLNFSFVFERVETQSEKSVRERGEEEKKKVEQQEENSLQSAKTDKNFIFKTPFIDIPLVRTGTIGDGSCFFHSVLKSIYPDYSDYSEEKRKKLVFTLRNKLSDKLTREEFEQLGGGNLAFSKIIPRFVNYINKNIPELYELVHKYEYDKESKNVQTYFNLLIEKIEESLKKRVTSIFKQFRDKILGEFKDSVSDCEVWVGNELNSVDLFEYLSNYLKIDIYIIKDSTRLPYKQGVDCSLRYKNRKSIIVLSASETHYESMGEIVDKEKGKIKRLFNPDDKLIKKIKEYIC